MVRMPAKEPQVALLTGASGGLGSVVLPMFRKAGYRVAAAALDWPKRPAGCLTMTADLTDPKAAQSAVQQTARRYRRIDCLVHMVGAWEADQAIEDTKDGVWQRMLAVNLTAAFHMMRAAIPVMKKAGGGRIVIVGSTAAIQPVRTWCAFSAAMGGLSALAQTAAAELRPHGITVNLIHPSTIDTAEVHRHYGDDESRKFVDPHAMGSLMLWLCSREGRDVSGSEIAMPGRQPHPAYDWPGLTS
jgi:NAD(P)-dependent dehydrogenase (short-subunit alcohol dehydrogenase family)